MSRFGSAAYRVDERIPGVDLPLLSVSQTLGVIRRSELTDKPARAETLDVYKVCRKGDIVFNKMSIRAGAMGVAQEDGLVTYHYEVIRLRPGYDARYLAYLMKSDYFTSEMIKRERGIGSGDQTGVRTTEVPFRILRTIDAYLPDHESQGAIADFLDRETAKIDALIAKQQALIGGLSARKSHLIEAGVGVGKGRLGVKLKYALSRIDQGISPDTSTGTDDARFWVLKAGCSNNGVFVESESKPVPGQVTVPSAITVREGDLITSRASLDLSSGRVWSW